MNPSQRGLKKINTKEKIYRENPNFQLKTSQESKYEPLDPLLPRKIKSSVNSPSISKTVVI